MASPELLVVKPASHDSSDDEEDADDTVSATVGGGGAKTRGRPATPSKRPVWSPPTRPTNASLPQMSDARAFMLNPGAHGSLTRCCLHRHGGGLFAARSYTFSLDTGLAEPGDMLASTTKRAHKMHASYTICCGPPSDALASADGCIGKLKSDASGTQFVLYGPGVNAQKISLWDDERDELDQQHMVARQQLAAVSYARTVVGRRKMLLPTYGPRAMSCEVVTAEHQSRARSLHNKPPEWDASTQAWVLDFHGRAPTVSSKNFQLCLDGSGDVVLQLGKVGRNAFTVDYSWPLSGLQAFGIALSAFDQKRSKS